MCDYSLMSIPNRLASEGEELVVHWFETGDTLVSNQRRPREPKSTSISTFLSRSLWISSAT